MSLFLAVIFFASLLSLPASAQTVDLQSIILMGADMGAAEQISSWQDVVSLSVSSGERGDFVLGLRSDGRVYAAGADDKGQCQVGDWENITKISAGNSFALGLCADGSVRCAGYGEKASPDTSSWLAVQDIAAGSEYVLGVGGSGQQLFSGLDEFNIDIWFRADTDDKVWENKEDEMRFWSELSQIRAAGENILGMDRSGEIRSFGFGPVRQVPELGQVLEFEVGLQNGGVICADGSAVIWGDNSCGQCDVSGSGFSKLSLGARHSLLLRSDGTVAAFGSDDCGQCQVSDWQNVVDVEAGNSCSFGITADGRVLMAGSLCAAQQN